MSFDYDKLAAKEGEHSSWWTSYADLFMMLSIVFLLMYVTSSLRAGSAGFQQQLENKALAQKAAGLEQQIKVYNTLKDESLKKEASVAEQQVYSKLMDKLTLLKEEARDEKDSLRRKAKENEEKEFALNQYQQLVKNIISANILAKSQIIHRDKVIVNKDATIEEKKQKIDEMEQIVAQNDQQIHTINTQLDQQINALRTEQSRSKSSKKAMERKIAQLREDSEAKIEELEENRNNVARELTQVKNTLQDTSVKLTDARGTIQQQDQTIAQQEQEKEALAKKLAADKNRYTQELADAKIAHEQQLANERDDFMDKLKKQRLSADEKARKIAQFAADSDRKSKELESQLGGLKDKIHDTDSKLRNAQNEYAAAQAKLAGTQQALAGTQAALGSTKQALAQTAAEKARAEGDRARAEADRARAQAALGNTREALAKTEADKTRALAAVNDLQGDLAKTRAIANARKVLAQQLTDEFAKSGMKGNVDGKTGEVTLDFGGEYFDTGSTSLKPKMRTTLDKFIPVYAKSLFSNPKLAEKIANVEIVGFASSTYKGKYVNPKSIKDDDKEAIGYNLKLSFGRANSIFEHVLNHGKMTKEEREKFMPLMKVVGRGYLPDGVNANEIPENITEKQFCEKYNCKKAQRVIVKFNMKD